MNLIDVYLKGKKILSEKKIDSASFDAMCIFEFCFNMDRTKLAINGQKQADESSCARFFKFISQRAIHRPLQYILGEWEFCGNTFKIGEGVLIPREETEILVETAIDFLANKKAPKILELCAGSGIISIILATKLKNADITCVEKSADAIHYLNKNIKLHSNKFLNSKIKILKNDVFSQNLHQNLSFFDLIISNPPYVCSKEIKTLQKEVQFEPQIALDGGNDGLNFYRVIAKNWVSHLSPFAGLAVELGAGQSEEVKKLFEKSKLKNILFKKDLYGIERVILGQRIPCFYSKPLSVL